VEGSATWLDTILQFAPIGICVMDRDLRFVRVNQSYIGASANIPESRLRGMTLVELMGSEFESVEAVLREVIATGAPASGRFAAPGDHGTSRTWEYTSHAIRDERGEVTQVMSFVADITSKLEAENEQTSRLQRAIDELAANRVKLEEAQSLARVGSWEANLITFQTNWSREARRMYEIGPDEPVSFELFLSRVHPDDRDYAYKCATDCMQTGKAVDFEYRVLLPSGRLRRIFARNRTVSDQGGRIVGLVGINQDITEQREMEARLVVQDRLSALGCLAAGLAHEINNPLSYVLGNSELALEELSTLRRSIDALPGIASSKAPLLAKLDELHSLVTESLEGGVRVRAIVRDMKTFSRGDGSDVSVPVDVNKVVDSTVGLAINEIRHRARFVRERGDVPLVLGTDSRLGEVVLNLLVNAAQAIPDDADPTQHEVRLVTRTDGAGNVVIEVSDTGCGIPRENLTRIFDPFFTTKPIGTGTGLGLAICHTLVKASGGDIVVHSELGRGTRFEIVLPPTAQVPARPSLAAVVEIKRRARVLVIDDEPMILKFSRRCLGGEHDVVTQSSASEALELINAGDKFDVIVCDLMMPVTTGIDFFQQLCAKHPAYADRIIFMTGGAFTARAQAFLDTVENTRLEKPFDPAQFRDAIRAKLEASLPAGAKASSEPCAPAGPRLVVV
jgi:PAS domain S-box-containing protein